MFKKRRGSNKIYPRKKLAVIAGICLAVVVLIIILCAKGCSNGPSRAEREYRNTITLVKKYMDKNQFDPALQLLNQLLIKNPDDEEANKLFDELIALKQQYDQMLMAQGAGGGNGYGGVYDVNIDTSSFTNALNSMNSQLNAANEANAKNQEALNRLLEQQQRDDKEREQERKALAEKQKEEAEKQKAIEEELAKKNKKLQEKINQINDKIQQGKSNLFAGKSQDALDSFAAAAKMLPIEEGEPKFSSTKLADMAQALYDAAQKEKDPAMVIKLNDAAITYANQAVSKNPNEARAHYILGLNAEKDNNLAKALAEFEAAVKGDSNNYLYYYYLGRVQFRQKQYQQAKGSFSESIRLNKNFDSSHFNLGMTCKRLKLNKEALKAFRDARTVNPQNAKAFLEEARLLYNAYNDAESAVTAYNKVIELEPVNAAALKECGSAYASLKNYAKAESCYRKAMALLKPGESDPFTNYNLSTVLFNQKKTSESYTYAKAAYDTKDALSNNKEKAMIVYNYALVTEATGNIDGAISLYREVLSLDPGNIKTKINLGVIFLGLNPPDLDSALVMLTDVYNSDKDNFEANNNLGSVYLSKKEYDKAIVFFQNALKIRPKDNVVRFNLAKAYAESSQFENAKVTYIAVLEQDSTVWDAYIEVAKVCIALKDTVSAEGYLVALQTKKPEFKKAQVDQLLATVRQ